MIKKKNILGTVIASLLLLITMYPFFLLICGSFKDKMQLTTNPWFFDNPLHFENYMVAIDGLIKPLFNSLLISLSGIMVVSLVAGLASFAIVYFNMPGKNIIYFYIVSLMMIPFFAILIPQFILVRDIGMYDTYLGQILPMAAGELALATMLMSSFFRSISSSLIEAARVEGCSDIKLFSQIVLPMSKPIMTTVAIMSGLHIWNNFLWPLVITSGNKVSPIILAITKITVTFEQGDGVAYAGYVIAALPILILFSFASQQFVAGMMAGAVKG